jgi:hypothetical protein
LLDLFIRIFVWGFVFPLSIIHTSYLKIKFVLFYKKEIDDIIKFTDDIIKYEFSEFEVELDSQKTLKYKYYINSGRTVINIERIEKLWILEELLNNTSIDENTRDIFKFKNKYDTYYLNLILKYIKLYNLKLNDILEEEILKRI